MHTKGIVEVKTRKYTNLKRYQSYPPNQSKNDGLRKVRITRLPCDVAFDVLYIQLTDSSRVVALASDYRVV